MELYVDNRSGVPAYEQIRRQLRAQILAGTLPPDALLPSIRSLAKDLRLSVITTKRAYEELEREKLIYTVPGKGCFVASQPLPQEAALPPELERRLQAAAETAKQYHIHSQRVSARLLEIMEETT